VPLACVAMPASTIEISVFNSEQWFGTNGRKLNSAGYFGAKIPIVRIEI
jgi:hypothetical protein